MNAAVSKQQFQDWFTQQVVIIRGIQFKTADFPWLIGPFGSKNGIGEEFIHQLAARENLTIQRNVKTHGLIQSMEQLGLSDAELALLPKPVIDFYKNTSDYQLSLSVKWNPFFKFFGILLNKLFSNRINQLNLPINQNRDSNSLKSEIITLLDSTTQVVKHTIWLRTNTISNRVMYSGIYGTCTLPSGKIGIKAVFPLPHGNATVIMTPRVSETGELILTSSGQRIGDAGFYFLVQDSKGGYWTQFVASFRDTLVVRANGDEVTAIQTLTLWNYRVVQLNYQIKLKK
ncbi:hypothetical protein [Flavobacterium sp. JP2137]|uniref:hypothetical protein n=1 Tax=Flavobacterium sp. JP2137 TaxID=3414510 RepID=UPI003D301225